MHLGVPEINDVSVAILAATKSQIQNQDDNLVVQHL